MICFVSYFCQAPEWAEGDVCHMCRVKFSTFQRQVSNLEKRILLRNYVENDFMKCDNWDKDDCSIYHY